MFDSFFFFFDSNDDRSGSSIIDFLDDFGVTAPEPGESDPTVEPELDVGLTDEPQVTVLGSDSADVFGL